MIQHYAVVMIKKKRRTLTSIKVLKQERRSKANSMLSGCECVAGCVTVVTERTAAQAYG